MERPIYKPNKIIPERVLKLRQELDWTQAQLCDAINERKPSIKRADGSSDNRKINSSVISAWETGRRPVPDAYQDTLCSIFGVTNGYLRGFTDDPNEEIDEPRKENSYDQRIEVPFESLYKYHGMPVYVVFKNYIHNDGWALYDDRNKQLVFCTYVLRLTKQNVQRMTFYRMAPSFAEQSPNWNKTRLSMKEMLGADRVYVSMHTHDLSVRNKYNGWYRHNEDHTYLIQAGSGIVLPYDGLNISYSAYPNVTP